MKRRHRLPPCIPNDCAVGGIEFDDDPAVIDLERRWARWWAAKTIMDDDWKRAAEAELAAVSTEIGRDLLISRLEHELEVDQSADDEHLDRYLEQFRILADKANARWKERAQARLTAVTRELNTDIVKREKLHFLGRK
jgi:hypothetical protein